MDPLLTPISTHTISKPRKPPANPTLTTAQNDSTPATHLNSDVPIDSPETALSALTAQPNQTSLFTTLRYLNSTTAKTQKSDFNILRPSPKAAQIIFALVDQVIPDYWGVLSEKHASRELLGARKSLVRCLAGCAGCGAIVSRLRGLIAEVRDAGKDVTSAKGKGKLVMETLMEVLEEVLRGDDFLGALWSDINAFAAREVDVTLLWKEVVALFGAGRMLSLLAEVEVVLNEVSGEVREGSWIGKGKEYAAWLGRNLKRMIDGLEEEDMGMRKEVTRMLGKGLGLGYPGRYYEKVFVSHG